MIDDLKQFLEDLKSLRKNLRAQATEQVAKKALRASANELGSRWHQKVYPKLRDAIGSETLDRYNTAFTRLIRLSAPNNQRSSYLETLAEVIPPFREDVIIPAEQGSLSVAPPSAYDSFFAALSNPDEGEYLREAIACARAGYLRAAAVLGWSAAIDRVHRKIEAIGFAKFNVTAAQMASQQSGRYKKFNQTQNVNSVSEMRQVFDNIVLWIVEGMGLIDSNQHTRLRSCFDMRCQSAHPGDAPITPFNLLSFFSDLDQIIFSNPKFTI
jgi:hypothetical protein